jgi:hypothetical protein
MNAFSVSGVQEKVYDIGYTTVHEGVFRRRYTTGEGIYERCTEKSEARRHSTR